MPRLLRWTLSLFLLVGQTGFVAAAESKSKATLHLQVVSLTGTLEYEIDGQKKVVSAGDKMPIIPAGAKINVISGSAVLSNGQVSVNADAGAKFQYTAKAQGGGVRTALIVAEKSKPVKAELDGNTVTIPPASAARLEMTSKGAVVSATDGKVTIQTATGETKTISEGSKLLVSGTGQSDTIKKGSPSEDGDVGAGPAADNNPPPPDTRQQELNVVSDSAP